MIRNGVDYAIVEGGDLVSLWYAMAILFSALLIEAIGQFVFIYFTNDLGARVIKDIRIKLFDHLLDFRIPFFDKTPIGTLVTRTVSDVETMAEIFSNGILVIFGDDPVYLEAIWRLPGHQTDSKMRMYHRALYYSKAFY